MDKHNEIKVAVLAGDTRQKILAELLSNDGYRVATAFSSDCEYVIGPVPCSKDGIALYEPGAETPCIIEELFQKMKECDCKMFIAGAISSNVQAIADKCGITTFDVMTLSEVAERNAVPTAEGAIQAAMECSDITLCGSKCLVMGYGKCGKVLARMLGGIGAGVAVQARSAVDEAYIKCYGYGFVHLDALDAALGEYDYIFNTIPAMILDKTKLEKINSDCLIIDIASLPGGVDFESAGLLGINAVNLPGLPGKVAPRTAARVLRDVIVKIIE